MRRGRWIAVAGVGVAAVVAWAIWGDRDRAYHDYVAALRASGEPVDYEGLVKTLPSSGDNGGSDFATGHQWLHDNVSWKRWESVVGPWNSSCEPDWPETSTPEQLAELAKFLDEIEPYIARVRSAASKAHIRFDADKRDVFGLPEPGATHRMQQAYKVLSAASVGEQDEAGRLGAVVTLASCATRVECVSWIDHSVAAVSLRIAIGDARRQVESGRIGAVPARARLDPFLHERWLDRMPTVLRCERVSMIQMYRTVVEGTWPFGSPSKWEQATHYVKTGKKKPAGSFVFEPERFAASDVVAHCEAMTAAIRLPLAPFGAYRRSLLAAMSSQSVSDPEMSPVTMMMRIGDVLCWTDAASGLARIALAAAEHRQTRGDYPASLAELAWAFPDGVPLDPFTDAPFVYERTAAGVRIASLGRLTEDPPLDEETLRERVLVWELR